MGYGSRSDPPLRLLLTYTHTPSSLQHGAALLAAASSGDEAALTALLALLAPLGTAAVHMINLNQDQVGA